MDVGTRKMEGGGLFQVLIDCNERDENEIYTQC